MIGELEADLNHPQSVYSESVKLSQDLEAIQARADEEKPLKNVLVVIERRQCAAAKIYEFL
jgi:hypothetical protein